MADKLVDDLKRALGDAYTIERELTGGGMSRVFVAKEHALGREVVIKVLPPDLAAGVNRERFRREVQLAARLSHPYIVPLLHAGEHDELLWFTMPYIAGESLRSRLLRDGALKLPEVLKLLHDVVEALAYAHSRGVIHRDIKPGNILSDGRHALVTDFGVAKALNAALPMGGPGHTTSGMAIGTPAYMAPEQLAADPEADHRVDIYAVGLLAYELLSGVSPFAAPSPTATMTAQLTRLPEPLHELHQEIPTAFSNLVQHCLAKSPEDRPPDAQAVLHELDNISGAMAADQHRSISGENGSRKRASSLPLVVATFGVLALVAGGFLWSQRGAVKPSGRADSGAVRVGGDTDLAAPIQPKPMTHQDSLRIAKALQSELAQLDAGKPKTSAKPTAPPPIDTAALARQLAAFDSVIKSRYAEMRRPSLPPDIGRNGAAAAAIGTSTAITIVQGNADKRVMVFASPLRGRDTVLRTLEAQVTGDLQKRLSGQRGYQVMPIDTTALTRGRSGRGGAGGGGGGGGGRNGPPGGGMFDSTDVVAFVSLQAGEHDSSVLRISLRNAASGTFESRAVTSKPIYKPTSIEPFLGTIADAVRTLNFLRRLPPGTAWPSDTGAGRRGQPGPGGPYVQPGAVYIDQKQIEQMRNFADSMRRLQPNMTKPKKRDSIP